MPRLRSSIWPARQLLPVAAAYALLSWLPVAYLSTMRGEASKLGSTGWLGWPFVSIPVTVLLTAVLFALAWWAMNAMQPRRFSHAGARNADLPGRVEVARRVDIARRVDVARRVDSACAVCLLAVLLVAYVVYIKYVEYYAPVTDRATALQYGFEEVLAGRNPYYRHTQLDNTISPMLGGILLAGPFVLASGTMYWQGMVWLLVTLSFLAWWRGPRMALVAGMLLLASPAMRLELALQSDGWVNGAALAIIGTTLHGLAGRSGRSRAWLAATLAVSVLFGMALAYRFIYLVVALPLGVLIWRRFGGRALLVAAAPAAVVSVALILGPYLADPSVYAPFQKASLGTHDHSLPHLPLITAVACSVVAAIGAASTRTIAGVWGTMCAVSVVFVVATGWGQGAWYQYLTWAFNGAALIFAFFAVGRPIANPGRERPADEPVAAPSPMPHPALSLRARTP